MPNINASARFAHPAPSERLPVEILLMIFEATLVADHSCVLEVMRAESAKFYASPRSIEYVKPAPLAAPLVLSQVSRRWRQIVLSTPSLWRNIAVPRFDWTTSDTAQSDFQADLVHHDNSGPPPGACKRLVALWLERAVSAGANKLNICHAHPPSSEPNPIPCEHDIDSYAERSSGSWRSSAEPEIDRESAPARFMYLLDVYVDLAAYHTHWESLNLVLDNHAIKKFARLIKAQRKRFKEEELDAVEVLGQNLKELTITLPMTLRRPEWHYLQEIFAWVRKLPNLRTFVFYDHFSNNLWCVDESSELTSSPPDEVSGTEFNSLEFVQNLTRVRLFPPVTDK
ncbi:hypothetical protein CPC08DRAFT_771042 [Agrocybe pediades]|nr:hypothetical protein CPC08DRAFT_771042 [Agrocybe pediades]